MFTLHFENENKSVVDLNDGTNYLVTDISGLNPPSASIYTSKSPNRKGVKYNGSTLNERYITVTIKLLGDVEASRNRLYDWVDTERYIKIRYSNGVKNVYCEGHVQDCEVPLFTNNETMTVAIICEDPYWKELSEIATSISNILNEFTIPFSIEEPIPFSTIKENNITTVFNGGAETGVLIKVNILEDVSYFHLYDSFDTTRRLEINTELKAGWKIEINTDSSPKTIKAYKLDNSVENLLKYTNHNITWFTLKRGRNGFAYDSDNDTNVEVTITYNSKHLGV